MMQFTTQIIPYTLHFIKPATTSRGVYHQHRVYYVLLLDPADPDHYGIGECAPLPDLSCDALPEGEYIEIIRQALAYIAQHGAIDYATLRPYPSVLFGLEVALRHYQQGSLCLWDSGFSRGENGIPINGLVWMADYKKMLAQIEQKIEQGFGCIKLKIGAIDFEQEIALLHYIRQHFTAKEIEIRVDANGAFALDQALNKLQRLAELDLHSIEQPIKAGQWQQMAELCQQTPLPIALDEELIGIHHYADKKRLLATIQPQYIILKPTLHGAIVGCQDWIDLASQHQTPWWLTSALESNIGLNAIAQWCATFNNPMPQGLGTGMLYHNNIALPLTIRQDRLWFTPGEHLLLLADIAG